MCHWIEFHRNSFGFFQGSEVDFLIAQNTKTKEDNYHKEQGIGMLMVQHAPSYI